MSLTAPKVSVIVPVYNPGEHLEQCVASLLGQSLPDDDYELIFVDDGSTDESPARLDALAAAHANVRVEHTPNSGWPGRPRNIGMGLARGDWIYFVDNDDWLEQEALERMHATAVRDDADIVIGKVVAHGKVVPGALFARNRQGMTVEWNTLLGLLTPHKLFRRRMLDEHAIRFPEGPRRLEDHLFTMHAYFHARSISVLADYPCYHWMFRHDDRNASWRPFEPVSYFENLREVLDLVEEHTEPGPFRDQLLAHWYRGKLLGRVGGGGFLARDPEYNRSIYDEVRRLAIERYGPEMNPYLSLNRRVRSRLLREGTYESLHALAVLERGLRAAVSLRGIRPDGGGLRLRLDGALLGEGGQLGFVRRGERLLWSPPDELAALLPDDEVDAKRAMRLSRIQLMLRARGRGEYVLGDEVRRLLVPAGPGTDRLRPVLTTEIVVDPRTAAGGAPLAEGLWDVHAAVIVAGFSASARVRRRNAPGFLRLAVGPDGRIAEHRPSRRLRHRVARRVARARGRPVAGE